MVIAWLVLALVACRSPAPPPAAPALVAAEGGTDHGQGSVVAVQAWMSPLDYASVDRLDARLRPWFEAARDRGWLQPNTVVVLPEYLGTWLVALGAPARTFEAPTTGQAMRGLVLRHLFRFATLRRGAPADDPNTYAVFAARSEVMAAAYQDVMSGLAKDFSVTLVAGSILLPGPAVSQGAITVDPGAPLVNASFVFGPDGALLGPPVEKAFPTEDEVAFVHPAPAAKLPVFDTPAGRLGVLVCADAWYPPAWAAMDAGGAQVVVVPQYTAGHGVWASPWRGYSGWPAPPDVDLSQEGVLTEKGAWETYAVPGRAAKHVRTAVTAPLRGSLWDLGTDAQPLWLAGGTHGEGPLTDGPEILRVWR